MTDPAAQDATKGCLEDAAIWWQLLNLTFQTFSTLSTAQDFNLFSFHFYVMGLR